MTDAKAISIQELQTSEPHVPLTSLMQETDYNISHVVVVGPQYFANLSILVFESDLNTWKQWYKWQISRYASAYLSEDLSAADFNFFSGVLSGISEQRPLEERAAEFVSNQLPDSVGQLYVDHYFPKQSKQYMEQLVQNLIKAYRRRIENLTWMSNITKWKALEKLDTLRAKIGYPDEWENMINVTIVPDNLLKNVMKLDEYRYMRNVDKLSKPVDKQAWARSAQTVNAYYSPLRNEVGFPAGILQPPFFDPCADDSMNYGAIGSIIGHEITHGFDSSGSRYGPTGEVQDWWTPQDKRKFEELTSRLVAQYSSYEVLPDLFVNGKLTLGENIADLGGMEVALDAYLMVVPQTEATRIGDDGFTGIQRFLLSYGRNWASLYRPEALRILVETNPHAPAKFRANGVVTNSPEFNKAFACEYKGLPSKDPVIIW